MKIKQALKYIGFLVVTLSLGGIACSNNPVGPSPKFLLTSSNSETNGNYEYYEINGGTEYAVGLTETGKSSTAAINIDSTYNEKPVTGIWRYGFANSRSSSITLPSSLTVIDYEAFMGSSITSITIPGSITQIGEAAFYGCKNITKVSIQNTTGSSETSSACSCDKVIIDDGGDATPCTLATIPGFCFFNCNNLKELILPQSIEEIGVEAFHNCRSLYTTLAFMSIRNIRSRAFQGCAALKNVYISSSFFTKDEEDKYGEIEDKAFDGCNSSLKFWLVCSTDDVDTWLSEHSDNRWRWKNETLNPETSSNLYTYEVTPSGAEYTSDWIFTTINGDVEITSYIGPVEIDDTPVKFLNVPDELPSGSGNKVRTIAVDAFNTVKANLERIYLPTTLRRIEKGMFNSSYSKLIVVDDSDTCMSDKETVDGGQNVEKRIDLHNITDLEVIANEAFKDMPKLKELTRLHLPYSLKAVGYRAFGSSENGKHLRKVTDFKWDYDDEKSVLEVIGGEAFYELGVDSDSASYSTVAKHRGYYKNNNADNPSNPLANKNYLLTELVFPRTFKHFGITGSDNNDFNLGGEEANDEKFGKSTFAGCPLISKVVFRGSLASTVQSATTSTVDTDTENLVIPTETFVMNESLRTVIFEERCGKNILFHTAGGNFKPAIGWSSGRSTNDFSGDPTLQTIVLPNKFTNLRMQKFAFAGNSRAVIYYSANKTNKIYGNTTAKCRDVISNITGNSTGIGNVPEWKRIGNEELLSSTYPGYWFADSNKNDLQNRFGIDQYIPENSSIYYKDTISTSGGDIDVIVGLGNSTEYVVKDKCAFICDSSKNATLTKYLYDRYDRNFTGTARVPAKVTRTLDSKECTVKTIGPSAFSAAYCDSTSYASVSTHLDLTAVEIPNSIITIREYAFMRAYGVTKLSSYNPSTGNLDGDYVMPSSLTTIGKHAFAFCNIKQFLKIPTNCLFYENNNSDTNTYETSAFTNNFSLRKITFGNDNATSSTYYTTTTYASNSGDTYTSAIYSTSSAPKNASLLLLVLNRDIGNDRTSSTASSLDCTISAGKSDFNGRYATQYLYGAFKMCYWIDSLTVGTANSNLPQPLISGIYDVANNKYKLVYLNTCNDFTANKNNNNLKYITFADTDEISTPPYSFEGCGNIIRVKLPQVENGHIPAGLFAAVDNADIIFVVPGDDNCETWKECAAGELDLTYTKYTHIDAEAFKGTNINVFTAPKVDTFTVEDSAFASCGELLTVDFSNVENEVIVNDNAFSNCAKLSTVDFSGTSGHVNTVTLNVDSFGNCNALTKVDFSRVTDEVILNGTFRNSTIKNDLFDFGSDALIEFGTEAFYKANFPGKKFTFPVKTTLIGTSCFEKCTTLEEVTALGNLTNLKHVVVDSEAGKNNEGNTTGFKQIGDYAFFQCTNLKKFNFDYFGEIERIGNYAFSMASEDTGKGYVTPTSAITNSATICTDGIVNLPDKITNLGVGAFSGSKIVTVTINSTEIMFERGKNYSNDPRAAGLSNGGHQFRRCTALTTITFTVPNCEWNTKYLLKSQDGQDNYFSECTSLTAIYFTSDYDLQYPLYTGSNNNQRPDSMVWDSNTDLKFYMYTTTSQYDPNGKAISEFWRRMKAGSTAPIVYWAATNADIVKLEDGKYKEIYAGQRYWAIVNGERTFLGMATSINETTGLVTFKISNTVTYYADSTHIYKA